MNRLLAVARLHLMVPARAFGLPWGIMTLAWALSVALFASFGDNGDVVIVGGLFSLYVILFLSAEQAVTRTLSFALALGATRRAFYLGTCGFLAAQALAAGAVLAALRAVERGTGGWGTRLSFFDVPYLVGGNPVQAAAAYAASLALVCAAGLAAGSVTRRWGTVGTSVLSAAAIVVPGVAVWWISAAGGLAPLGNWLAGQPAFALRTLWPLGFATVLAAIGWTAVRRTPA